MVIKLIQSKVVLKEMIKSDWEDVLKYASLEIVCQYQPWGPNTEEETQAFVKQVLLDAKKENRSRYVFSVFEKENRSILVLGRSVFVILGWVKLVTFFILTIGGRELLLKSQSFSYNLDLKG